MIWLGWKGPLKGAFFYYFCNDIYRRLLIQSFLEFIGHGINPYPKQGGGVESGFIDQEVFIDEDGTIQKLVPTKYNECYRTYSFDLRIDLYCPRFP